jgi:hypothetical protein
MVFGENPMKDYFTNSPLSPINQATNAGNQSINKTLSAHLYFNKGGSKRTKRTKRTRRSRQHKKTRRVGTKRLKIKSLRLRKSKTRQRKRLGTLLKKNSKESRKVYKGGNLFSSMSGSMSGLGSTMSSKLGGVGSAISDLGTSAKSAITTTTTPPPTTTPTTTTTTTTKPPTTTTPTAVGTTQGVNVLVKPIPGGSKSSLYKLTDVGSNLAGVSTKTNHVNSKLSFWNTKSF